MEREIPQEWERRCAALWDAFDDHEPDAFRAAMAGLAGELPAGHPAGVFERASAADATDREAEAVALYREALDAGLDGARRRQAVIQLASTLRAVGDAAAAAALLEEERDRCSDALDGAVLAFLALAYSDLGREREATALALGALAPHLPAYRKSVARYAEALTRP
ncbi:tetratricopeptide repeat protein [Actinomadura parmotrematis]|uniref:Tetratricopeptide repeat protein n=1 Tax=Actinomadura parmotrematis TaxID=2864039 RepID=A0ABS7FNZ4_9ACTN|nr:tetratricopeptide repeat protein [Actinomadura parmotrematis]MBW8482098.1 tetratricopeptide repeat protein [Actinomadura parmotrematis]